MNDCFSMQCFDSIKHHFCKREYLLLWHWCIIALDEWSQVSFTKLADKIDIVCSLIDFYNVDDIGMPDGFDCLYFIAEEFLFKGGLNFFEFYDFDGHLLLSFGMDSFVDFRREPAAQDICGAKPVVSYFFDNGLWLFCFHLL